MPPTPYRVPHFLLEPLPAPELRKDPLLDRWVLVSTDRAQRPIEVAPERPPLAGRDCPFCRGREDQTPEPVLVVPDGAGGWAVRVVPNRFPAVRGVDGPAPAADPFTPGRPGYGRHEVVIECPHHERDLSRLSAGAVAAVLGAWRERVGAFRRDGRLAYCVAFKNVGAEAGASLEHAHSQLIGLPAVPSQVRAEVEGAARFRAEHGGCFFCELAAREEGGERFVAANGRFVAVVPYAGRFPFEVWLLPRRHEGHFDALTDAERDDLGGLLFDVLRRLDAGLEAPPYNIVLHTAPFAAGQVPHYHWHLEVLPRLTGLAGFECGTDWFINPVPPEQAARYLRSVNGSLPVG